MAFKKDLMILKNYVHTINDIINLSLDMFVNMIEKFFLPLGAADKKLKIQFCKIQKYYSSEEGLTLRCFYCL